MTYNNSLLDEFCGSKFWDVNRTWHTENPEFTPCFHKTVLVWMPCAYLWIAAILDIYYIVHSKEKDIPWNMLNKSKLFVICWLIVGKFVDLGVALYNSSQNKDTVSYADYSSPVLKILTFSLSATLMYYNRKFGRRTSGVLFFFWLLLMLTGLPQLKSEITLQSEKTDVENGQYNFFSYMVYYTLIVLMFILNWFADLPPRETPYHYEKNPCPENAASFPSRLTFSWFDPLALNGFRKSLTEADLWSLNPQDSSQEIVPRFDKFWERSVTKRENGARTKYSIILANESFRPKEKPASILPALCLAFGNQFLFGSLLKLFYDILMFMLPQLLKLLIGFAGSKEHLWKGYLYAVGLLACASVQTLLSSHYFLRMSIVGMKIGTALTSAIYRKFLKMSNTARKVFTIGEIVNLISVDAHNLTTHLNMIWSAPLQISLALYFLWGTLGPAMLAGLAVMIFIIFFNSLMANKIKTLQIRQMKYKDERIKLLNEVLNGIKVLKMYAWEPSFEEQILKIRNKEMLILKQTAYLNSITSIMWTGAPTLLALMSYTCFVLLNDTERLDAERAFVSFALFNILRAPLSFLPTVISNIVQAAVSIKRLNNFLNCEELDEDAVEHDPKESNPLVIQKGFFSWGELPVLRNISLEVPRGHLVAVVGAVGSGKSSLLSALLGEMNKLAGRVNTYGKIAYVPQQAWIQNATLQDNITFGKRLDTYRYNNVIHVCALKPDFDMLPGGDQTEIGERGINLSGGQKQRVSLARAVYFDADNYFLDDPLSAVDAHVGKHIFDKVIGPSGLLKDKTRVWVTHNVSYLAQTDLVVVLRDGEISEVGTYQQLIEKRGTFAEFLAHHINDLERTKSPESTETTKELKASFESELQREKSLTECHLESEDTTGDCFGSIKRLELETEKTTTEWKEKSKIIEAEKVETGGVKWKVYMHYLASAGVAATTLTILTNLSLTVLQVNSNFWLAKWSNDESVLVNGTIERTKRDLYIGVYGGFSFGQMIALAIASVTLFLGTLEAGRMLHAALLSGVLRAPTIGFFDCTPVGRVLNRFSKDVDVLDNVLPMTLRGWIFSFCACLGRLFVISFSTPMIIAVVLPTGFLYYVIQRFYVATSRQLRRLESITRSPIYSHFGESITGASTIRAYGVTKRFVEESERGVDHNQSCYYPSCIANRWLAVRLEMIGNLIIFFAALFAVLGRDTINPGFVGLSVSYALQITLALNWLMRVSSDLETNIVAVERIKEYTETQQEPAWKVSNGPSSTWPETGALELQDLTLGYRTGEPALRGITCTVAPRDKIGIVGRTGAGKSTLTLGLFRIVEALKGKILIDGIDISSIGLHQLRSRITIIPQDPVLFSGTLRMNLDPFEAFTDEEIWRSLEHAHLKTFVEGLSAGLRHEVSEGGENLSVGQRQLVCLARALLRKTPLLVLDEATAAVDLETDDVIQKTIRSEFASCTVLTIAHRLNTIMDSTRVMVLDQGALVDFASPEELLQRKDGIFYSMAKDAGLIN